MKKIISNELAQCHECVPGIKKLPLPVFVIILTVAAVNVGVWVCVGIVLVSPNITAQAEDSGRIAIIVLYSVLLTPS